MKKQMNYLFLDFDGVLNTENYQRMLKESGAKASDEYGALFDPKAVTNLKEIISRTNAKVCLISSWGYEGEERMLRLWKDRNMPGKLYAVCCGAPIDFDDMDFTCEDPTPEIMVGKGRDIKAFLSHRSSPCNYVILDDVPDFFPDQMSHYIQINPKTGITEETVKDAVEILME